MIERALSPDDHRPTNPCVQPMAEGYNLLMFVQHTLTIPPIDQSIGKEYQVPSKEDDNKLNNTFIMVLSAKDRCEYSSIFSPQTRGNSVHPSVVLLPATERGESRNE